MSHERDNMAKERYANKRELDQIRDESKMLEKQKKEFEEEKSKEVEKERSKSRDRSTERDNPKLNTKSEVDIGMSTSS